MAFFIRVSKVPFFVGVSSVPSADVWRVMGLEGGVHPPRPTRAHPEEDDDANDSQDWKPGNVVREGTVDSKA